MKSCGPKALAILHQHGVLNLTQRCPSTGKTVLHQWASAGCMTSFSSSSVDVVQLLLDWGADLLAVDSRGFSVILTAAKGHQGKPNEAVLDVLLDREDIERMEKIKALELAGAIILGYYPEEVHLRRAFGYWRRALILRTTHHLPKTDALILLDGRFTEWTTMAELKKLEKGTKSDHQTQSFLVLLRILSGLSFNALDDFVYNYSFSGNAVIFSDIESNTHGLQLLDLDFFRIILTVLHRRCSWHPSEKEKVQFFAICLNTPLTDSLVGYFENGDPLIHSAETWKTSLELISAFDLTDYVEQEGTDYPYLETLFDLFSVLSQLSFEMLDGLKPLLKILMQQDYRNSKGENILLYSVAHNDVTAAMISLLIEAKANLHSADHNGNGVLHFLAMNATEKIDSIARLLRNAGAHPDQVNAQRKTAAQVWLNTKQTKEEGDRVWLKSDLPDWCKEENVPKMICLASRIIRQHRIPYVGEIPSTLDPFVAIH